jgi:hypothetical protein
MSWQALATTNQHTLWYFWIIILFSVSRLSVYKKTPFFCVVSEIVISGTSFLKTLQNHIIIDNFQNLFSATTKMYYTFLGRIGFWTQGFALVKQVLYFLSHTSSTYLRDNLDFENLLLWELSGCTPLPKAIEIIHFEWENENWILFIEYVTYALVLQNLKWIFGEKEKVVRNKDPRRNSTE